MLDTSWRSCEQVRDRDRDILDLIDGGSQHSDDIATLLAGHKLREKDEPRHTGTSHSQSENAECAMDTGQKSPVWHFNLATSPEFVLRPVDVSRSTPSPERPVFY